MVEQEGEDASVGSKHWLRKVRSTRLSAAECRQLAVTARGGCDFGEFVSVGELRPASAELRKRVLMATGDVLLRLQSQPVSGFTLRDAADWLKSLVDADLREIEFETVRSSALNRKLKPFLRKRFKRGSVDHQLQLTIRNNLYLRTVPCTTRAARDGEVDGTHYRFVSLQAFKQLERSGELLEYGFHAGNYYGTPKPPHGATALRLSLSLSNPNSTAAQKTEPQQLQLQLQPRPEAETHQQPEEATRLIPVVPFREDEVSELGSVEAEVTICHSRPSVSEIFAGRPVVFSPARASESARSSPIRVNQRANSLGRRSNVEEQELKHRTDANGNLLLVDSSSVAAALNNPDTASMTTSLNDDSTARINAEYATTLGSATDHSSNSNSTALLIGNEEAEAMNQQQQDRQDQLNVSDATASATITDDAGINGSAVTTAGDEEELPYGWECVHDPQYGVYFIDHVQKRTQYEHPKTTMEDRMDVARSPAMHLETSGVQYNAVPPFSRDPSCLPGECITVELVKGIRGFGFSLVGSDRADDSFLQVKSILRHGPAEVDGRLTRGDILVAVDGESVLGYSYDRIVRLFQSIAIGSPTLLSVSKYYRLPYGEAGPQRVVKQLAVDAPAESMAERDGDAEVGQPEVIDSATGLIRVRLKKIDHSFGFTIARNANGLHYVHNISRNVDQCRALRVGDILFAVDSINVLQASHADIIGVFKRIQHGQLVQLTVLRLPSLEPETLAHHSNNAIVVSTDTDVLDGQLVDDVSMVPVIRRSANSAASSVVVDDLQSSRDAVPAQTSALVSPPLSASPSGTGSSHSQLPSNGIVPRSPPALSYWDSFEVRLRRNDKGFGFRLSGGCEYGQQVAIGFVLAGSPADEAGLKTADQIIAIDHVGVLGATHADAMRLLTLAVRDRGECTLRLRRRKDTGSSSTVDWNKIEHGSALESGYSSGPASNSNSNSSATNEITVAIRDHEIPSASGQSSSTYDGVCEVTLKRTVNETFGFVIVSSTTRSGEYVGEFVGRIVANSPADRCPQLKVGQRIVAVNGVPISGLSHESVVQLIKESHMTLSLSLVDTAVRAPPAVIPLPPAMSAQVGLDALATMNLHDTTLPADVGHIEQPPPIMPAQTAIINNDIPGDVFELELARAPSVGFGFSLRGGREFGQPLAVHRLADGSSAARSGRIAIGDEILAVNGRSASSLTHQQAVELIQSSGLRVHLVLRKVVQKQLTPPRNLPDGALSKLIPGEGRSGLNPPVVIRQRNSSVPAPVRQSVVSGVVGQQTVGATVQNWLVNNQMPNALSNAQTYNHPGQQTTAAQSSYAVRPAAWQAGGYAAAPNRSINGSGNASASNQNVQHSSSYRV